MLRRRRLDSAVLRNACVGSPIGGWSGLSALLLLCLSTLASAQQYQADAVDDKARLLGPTAQNCVKDSSRYATDKERFTEYFTKYYFPAMTRFEPNDLAELGDMRYNLFIQYLWKAENEELQSDLTDIAFNAVSRIITDKKYHPAVRYNAILIVGMLDQQYAHRERTKSAPAQTVATGQ